MNGLARWSRDKGDLVRQTFENILRGSDILALQEASGFRVYYPEWADDFDICLLDREPDNYSGARSYQQFVVLARRSMFEVERAESIPGGKVVGIRCVFQVP